MSLLHLFRVCGLTRGNAPSSGSPGGGGVPAEGMQTVSFTVDTSTEFPNPERGWHKNETFLDINGGSGGSFGYIRTSHGMTLNRSYLRLDNWRSQDLPAWYLDAHLPRFQAARDAGIKLILRYSYNFGEGGDTSLYWVQRHIEQLAPIWAQGEDVMALLQAGFIGRWGEWNGSTNDLTSAANKYAITSALLDAMPSSRMIQIRTPYHFIEALGGTYSLGGWTTGPAPSTVTTPFNAALLPTADRFDGSDLARVGHKNDSFLRNYTDAGTYAFPDVGYNHIEAHRDYLKNWIFDSSRYVVHGGELVEDVAWTDGNREAGADAINEMSLIHTDYLNRDYGTPAINGWISSGHFPGITRRLGYRLALLEATVPLTVNPNGTMDVSFTMRNDGFGKVYNPRPIDLVFVGSGGPFTVRLTSDARRDLPLGGETKVLAYTVTAPAGLVEGAAYTLHLSLPDPDPNGNGLGADPRYSIRLANTGVWDGDAGWNDLGVTVTGG